MTASGTPNKTALTATKVQELKNLCIKNNLPITGNKADIIDRLLEFFRTPQPTPSKQPLKATVPVPVQPPKEVLELPKSSHPSPSSQPQPSNATTTEVEKPPVQHSQVVYSPAAPQSTNDTADPVELEILKRQQRAQRFGLTDPKLDEEQMKKLNRLKKFGMVDDGKLDKALGDEKFTSATPQKNQMAHDPEWEEKKRKRAEKFGTPYSRPSPKLVKS